MDKIVKFIECLMPITACNLKCEYCYVIQENRRKNEIPKLKYTPGQIRKALNKERLGGLAYISICGAGETLAVKEMVDIVKELLEEGHYINITTNGTLDKRFDEIVSKIPEINLKRLHFAFSLHYIELKNKGLLDKFVANINKVQKAGCSYTLQMNLCDSYIEIKDEIKKFCEENFGFLPQLAATRDEKDGINMKLYTKYSDREYYDFGKDFKSPLFEYTMKNFMKKRREFCYAGDWSFLLNLATGEMKKCYASSKTVNILEKPEEKIDFKAIGTNCESPFCVNSSHFMSLGIIPELKEEPTYAELRARGNSYTDCMKNFLNQKLYDNNAEYSNLKKKIINVKGNINGKVMKCGRRVKQKLRKIGQSIQ